MAIGDMERSLKKYYEKPFNETALCGKCLFLQAK